MTREQTPYTIAAVRYAKAAEREQARIDSLLARGFGADRLRDDMVLAARRRTAEHFRILCSPAVIAATMPHNGEDH